MHPANGWSDPDAAWAGDDAGVPAGGPARSGWGGPADPPASRSWADRLSRFGNRPVALPAPMSPREARQPVNGSHFGERTAVASPQPDPQVPVSAPPHPYDVDREEGPQQRMIVPAPRPPGDRSGPQIPGQPGAGQQPPRSRPGEPGHPEPARHALDDTGAGGPVGQPASWRDATSSVPASGPPLPASGPPFGGSGPVSAPPFEAEAPPGFRPAPSPAAPYESAAPEYESTSAAYRPARPFDSDGAHEHPGYQPGAPYEAPGRPYEAAGQSAGPYEASGSYEPPGTRETPGPYESAGRYEAVGPYEPSGYDSATGYDRDRLRAGADRDRLRAEADRAGGPPIPPRQADPGTRTGRSGDDDGTARGDTAGRTGPTGRTPTTAAGGAEPTRTGARRAPERDPAGSRFLRSVPDSERGPGPGAGATPETRAMRTSDADALSGRDPAARDWSSSWVPPWATERSDPDAAPRQADWTARWSDPPAEPPPAQPTPVRPPTAAHPRYHQPVDPPAEPGRQGGYAEQPPYRPYGYEPAAEEPVTATRPGDPAAEGLPQRVPAEPDVPTVPEPPAVDPPAETPELARIATHLRREDASPEIRERPEGFDVNAILAAVRGVPGVRDATLRKTPAGAHSLRLDLADGADPAEVSRQVARLLQERMGLAAAPQNLAGPADAGMATPPPSAAGPPTPARPTGHSAPARPAGHGTPARSGGAGTPAPPPAAPSSGTAGAASGAGQPRPGPDWHRGSSGYAEIPPDIPRRRRRQGSGPRGRAPVEERRTEPADAGPPPGLLGPSGNSPLTAGTSYSGGQLTTTESAPSRPLNPDGPPGPRVVIDHVQVSTFGLDATVEVRLGAAERDATGLASGPAVDGYVLRLCAVAAAAAIDELLRTSGGLAGRGRCFVEHAAVIPFGSCEVATVVVLLVCDGWVEQLAGSALVSGDPRQAVVRAALAAVNRRLEALLA